MDRNQMYFVELPADREALWERITDFLVSWRDVAGGDLGTEQGGLGAVEGALGCAFPPSLREFYRRFSSAVRAGLFNDEGNRVLPPEECYFEDEAEDSCPTLVIAVGNYSGLWGVREDELKEPDPPVRGIEEGGYVHDDLCSLTEFLVGQLFRSAVENAPFKLVVDPFPNRWDRVQEIHDELLRNFQPWVRDNRERECGFLSHIEGPGVLAALSEESLTIGLRNPDSIDTFPEPLRGMIQNFA